MKADIGKIENIYYKRIALFRDLLDCVARERDNLINQDINGIWSSLEEKRKILESIEETGEHFTNIAGKQFSYHDIPSNDRPAIQKLSLTLSDLKEEIRARVAENVSFIEETLGFFHEIISVFTMAGQAQGSYGPVKDPRRGTSSIMYHNEV